MAENPRLAEPAILMTVAIARPVTLGGGTGRVSTIFGIRPEQSASRWRAPAQAGVVQR
jgi:hypothetical protein